ncbi:MAG: hypothetical protein IKV18_03245 [Alistipes sp.]|nr:hypothetical protein [Alistipes sp.]
MKKLFIAAMALATIVSCSKDDAPAQVDLSNKSVQITIKNMASDTRVAGGQTANGEEDACAEASELIFLFCNSAGNLVQSRTLSDAQQTTPDGTLDTQNPGEKAYLFHKLPENVTQVGVIANVESAPASLAEAVALWQNESNLVAEKYTDVVAYSIPQAGNGIALVQSGTCTVGEGENQHTYPLFTANVTVTPYMARIEIGHIGCKDLAATDNAGYSKIGIQSLSLAGGALAIDNDVNGTATAVTATNAPYTIQMGTFANDAAVTGAYALTAAHKVEDDANVVVPTTADADCWSWNILPQNVSNLTTNIYVVGNGYKVPTGSEGKTVTINSYKVEGTTINTFDAANIYKFNICFSESNIDETNNYICADVDVTIAQWVVNDVKVDFATK